MVNSVKGKLHPIRIAPIHHRVSFLFSAHAMDYSYVSSLALSLSHSFPSTSTSQSPNTRQRKQTHGAQTPTNPSNPPLNPSSNNNQLRAQISSIPIRHHAIIRFRLQQMRPATEPHRVRERTAQRSKYRRTLGLCAGLFGSGFSLHGSVQDDI